MQRHELIRKMAIILLKKPAEHPLRVAVDGVDAAGKTFFADELAQCLAGSGRPVIRASVDGFHHPRAHRYRKGPLSPEGFYEDSFNYPALIENLLLPLSPGGSRRYRTAVFDVRQDCPLEAAWQTAENHAILIVDGIFLHRPILLPHWDVTLFLQADFVTTIARGTARDHHLFESQQAALHHYRRRYVPGQKLYLAESRPLDKADILIDNNILEDPELIRLSVNSHCSEQENTQD